MGDWGLGPIPNPQSPIPQSPIPNLNLIIIIGNIRKYKKKYYIDIIFH